MDGVGAHGARLLSGGCRKLKVSRGGECILFCDIYSSVTIKSPIFQQITPIKADAGSPSENQYVTKSKTKNAIKVEKGLDGKKRVKGNVRRIRYKNKNRHDYDSHAFIHI